MLRCKSLVRFLTVTSVLAGFLAVPLVSVAADPGKPLVYPEARKGDFVGVYHGAVVPDPYRWLEDPDSSESRAWIEAENKVTYGYLNQIPEREKIRKRLTELWDYEKFSVPWKKGGRYFFEKNDGLQNQDVLYTMKSLDEEPRVLIDPNKLSEDGTVALRGLSVSEDGKLLAYSLSKAGSDWQDWYVRDIDTGKDLTDHLEWVKFSGASWTKDGKGFFYSRFDEPKPGEELQAQNFYNKLYYHRIGTPQSQDVKVYDRPDQKEWGFSGDVTDDGKYLIIYVSHGTRRKNMILYKDLEVADAKVVELIDKFEAQYSVIDNDGPVFWVRTDQNAPRGRVVAIDIRNPEQSNWKEVIPEARATLRSVNLVGNLFVAEYLKDAYTEVKVFDIDGTMVRTVPFPGLGTAYGFGGKREDTETFYAFTSFTIPTRIYRYDMTLGVGEILWEPKVDVDPTLYETKQVFYRSKDGTEVPMFITYKKPAMLNGDSPTLLYGYGGFNHSMTPRFGVSKIVWMEMGGVYAVANIRGGGEYGKAWHEAGMKLTKQNCFDDFIAAAEWLIANKYTSTPKLAIEGASNGGLLVGACMTQRPDLFGACLPAVGVMDMLRFHKFTIGWAWVSDYGTPDDPEKPEEFKALRAYSPLHNLKAGTAYPATMITTADHDDRVVPAHSFKFAAALQAAQAGPAPVLIRVEVDAGHGLGKPTSKLIRETADLWAFLAHRLEIDLA